MKHYITVYVNGSKQNTILLNSLPAFNTGKITIGRLDTNDIILPYPFVSRSHAVLEIRNNIAEIVDAGSLNKLRVGGTAYERIRLSNGMNVTIGNADNIITLSYNTLEDAAVYNPQQKSDTAEYGTPKSKQIKKPEPEPLQTTPPSGFGLRLFAGIMDSTICMFMGIGAAIIILLLLNSFVSGIKIIVLLTLIISIFVVWIYFALGESGESKGTMGKIAMGLWVVDSKTDEKISFNKATKRYFAKILSVLIIFLGFIPMYGKKQTLHDYIAGTKVIKNPRVKE